MPTAKWLLASCLIAVTAGCTATATTGYYPSTANRGGYWNSPSRDYDRDGMPNRYDRDANGDGIPDRYQR